jgi:hypothetical protein
MKNSRTNPGSYAELRMWAEALADAMDARIAFENKDRSGTVEMDAFGPVVDMYQAAEDQCRKEMIACYRVTVPEGVRKWQEQTAGIGESTVARLLGMTGDPRMAYPRHWEGAGSDRHLVDDPAHERGVGALWQYCGVGAPKNREVKGDAAALMANGRPDAKKMVYLLSTAQVKSNAKGGAAYRGIYDAAKDKYREKVHSVPCAGGFSGPLYVKCKTHVPVDWELLPERDDLPGAHPMDLFASDMLGAEFGRPAEQDKRAGELDAKSEQKRKAKLGYAQAGDPFQPSHVHAIALRHTGKEILRDLWLTAGGQDPVYGTVRVGEENRGRHRNRTGGGITQ